MTVLVEVCCDRVNNFYIDFLAISQCSSLKSEYDAYLVDIVRSYLSSGE
jgi:hypothetical protein